MIDLVNQQRKIKINTEMCGEIADKAIQLIKKPQNKTLTIAFVSDQKMRQLNRNFRGKNSTTDVLSFPNDPDEFDEESANNLGDVIISAEQAARQAAENNLTLEIEISQLILHGILHLCGYDHENDLGEMNALELRLRAELGIA